ncbi:DUF2480 family protein [Aquimarina sp. BL5]|uniref:DUF2480 family protein n=1 Tax=Aquimarina sp. BL5 TaxID=1714860 RepID=UPI000E538FB6|nr:DUF2480 family protein [Aquimarina sp. BL5]AXT52035.1 DUF2480 family protein [Aquimarina sp. BL5]RKN11147.1 DUF2480 family protein [Aquimarina sp. BL5]
MAEEIINRVANNTKLFTIDLEDYYPEGDRILFDIKDWLFEGFILKEKDFRKYVSDHDWSQYQNKYVALSCSTDAIIPGWAYLLLTSSLMPFAKKVAVGSLENLETILYTGIINALDVSEYQDKLLIIKGCSNKPVPESAYIELIQKLQPVAKSIMYGEACSSVPLFKRK